MSLPVPGAPHITPLLVPAESVPEHGGATGVLSQAERRGDWMLPRVFRALSVLGQVTIDLTEVRIGPGRSEIEAIAVLGEVKILVPHNLRVECAGDSVMGEFKIQRRVNSVPSPDAPLVWIKGNAVLGTVTVKVVDPNEPGRLRRWLEKRKRD